MGGHAVQRRRDRLHGAAEAQSSVGVEVPRNFEAAPASLLPGHVATMLAGLDDREREIIRLRFGLDREEPRTLEEVGSRFDLSRERIRQIEARAMSKLRRPTAAQGLMSC